MADDTVLVYGRDASWEDCATMDDYAFGKSLVAREPYHPATFDLHRVPRPLWERWQAARAEYRAAMYAMNESPSVNLTVVRESITSAARNGNSPAPSAEVDG